jgi:hypothetical protein
MKRAAQIVSWLMIGLMLVGTFGLYGTNPNLVGPASIIPLLPFAAALVVYHTQVDRWFVWIAFALNCLVAFIGLGLCVVAVFVGGVDAIGILLAALLALVPTALNTLMLWRYLGARKVAPAS